MNNVVYMRIANRQRAERSAALLKAAQPSMAERFFYWIRNWRKFK